MGKKYRITKQSDEIYLIETQELLGLVWRSLMYKESSAFDTVETPYEFSSYSAAHEYMEDGNMQDDLDKGLVR